MEVVAYSTAEEYDLEALMDGLREQNLYHPSAMSEGRRATPSLWARAPDFDGS